jgi:multimeric flavodoxin WrbA
MKICVLSGSPKGEKSITLQYIRFLEQAFPEVNFSVVHIGRNIGSIEENLPEWEEVLGRVNGADGVLWATPVYYMLVPAQLKRFIELIGERDRKEVFNGVYTAALTTSIHFFDHTAHNYLHGICDDLGMRYVGFFSAHMNDLRTTIPQERLVSFFADFQKAIEEKRQVQREFSPLPLFSPAYTPRNHPVPVDTHGKQVVILHDAEPGSDQEAMVRQMGGIFSGPVRIADIRESLMKGGCLGCCRCAFNNTCVYDDGFRSFWDEQVVPADILIMAGTIRDRYFSATWKQFFDRSFFNGHVPTIAGKQVAYLVEGPLTHLPNFREILTSRVMLGKANLAGIVTSEPEDPDETDAALQAVAERAVAFSDRGYIAPATFQAVGGHKIFRDEIWGGMRAVFKADDRYYRQHGFYDFPTWNYSQRIGTRLLSFVLDIPQVRRHAEKDMASHMVQPLQRSVETSQVLAKRKAGK